MDHALRSISYIADIGDLVVLMARRRTLEDDPGGGKLRRTPKMICHVFESEEAQFIAQSIGQAFQVRPCRARHLFTKCDENMLCLGREKV